MKKIYSLLLCSGLVTTAIAQQEIPNGGFETWETISYESTSYEAPSPWDPGSFCASSGSSATCSVKGTQSTDAFSGDYAMELDSEEGFVVALEDHPVTGNERPIGVEFMAKTSIGTGAYFTATVYFHNGPLFGDIETIGTADFSINQSSTSYAQFSEDVRFFKEDDYEYMSIILTFDESDFSPASTVTIDDMELVYDIATGIHAKENSEKTISATMVDQKLVFDKAISSYKILGQQGKQLLQGTTQQVNVSVLNSGVYFVKAITTNGDVFTYRIYKR